MFFFDRVPEVEPEQLIAEAGRGEPVQVLDIRAPEYAAAGALELPPPARYLNVPGSRLVAAGDPARVGLDRSLPVAVVCALGHSSRQVTLYLNQRGFQARSVVGGMARWATTQVARELAPPPGFDRLVQVDRVAKGALGYVVDRGRRGAAGRRAARSRSPTSTSRSGPARGSSRSPTPTATPTTSRAGPGSRASSASPTTSTPRMRSTPTRGGRGRSRSRRSPTGSRSGSAARGWR